MKSVENSKIVKEKPYRLTRSEYMQWRNDQKMKVKVKAQVLLLAQQVRSWAEDSSLAREN